MVRQILIRIASVNEAGGSGLLSKLHLSGERARWLTIGVNLGGASLRIAPLDDLAGIALPTRAAHGPEAIVLNILPSQRMGPALRI